MTSRPTDSQSPPTMSASELESLREQLARIDAAWRDLVVQRVALCGRYAEQLRESNAPPLPSELVAPQLNAPEDVAREPWHAMLRELHSASVVAIRPYRVAYLGPQFSYSHQAALQHFGHGHTLSPVNSIAAVFETVAREQSDFGLVPLENSTDGRITDTLEVFSRLPTRICGEVQLRVHHCLWGAARIEQVREVHSKPQALSQCRRWLAEHLPSAQCVAAASTAAAAELATTRDDVAAVASRAAGEALGLHLLAENIEDNASNVTRFAVLGNSTPPRSQRDKTALMFELPHRPGALADVTMVFKKYRLNLTWVESFPKVGSSNEYVFFAEFVGHAAERRAGRALRDLHAKTARLTVLGSYPAG